MPPSATGSAWCCGAMTLFFVEITAATQLVLLCRPASAGLGQNRTMGVLALQMQSNTRVERLENGTAL